MGKYNVDIARYTDVSKELRFTNIKTIEFLRNNIDRIFFVKVKVASYVNKILFRRKTFKSSIKYIKNKSSVRKVLTETNREILSNFDFYGEHQILSHKIEFVSDDSKAGSSGNIVVITKKEKALKGYAESYKIEVLNDKDPRIQFEKVRDSLKRLLFDKTLHKYIQTLVVTFKKESKSADGSKAGSAAFTYKTAYFNSITKTILSGFDIGLDEANSDILNFIDIWISEGSGWTIERIEKHFINFVKYQPLKGSSYVKLPKDFQNSLKGLINIQNKDNECFTWCHIRYLNPQKKNPQRKKILTKNLSVN